MAELAIPEPQGPTRAEIEQSAWDDLMQDVHDGNIEREVADWLMHRFFPDFPIPNGEA